MTHLRVTDIQYRADSCALFEAIADFPYATWLDSGRPWSQYGRYDIISALPDTVLTCASCTTGESTTCAVSSHGRRHYSGNPFDIVQAHLRPLEINIAKDLPFCGGALGYFGYDLGRYEQKIPSRATADIELPEMHIGIYSWAIVQDHHQRHAWLICLPCCPASTQRDILLKLADNNAKQTPQQHNILFSINNLKSNIDIGNYKIQLQKISDYILAGDCYQVNFSQRYSAEFNGSAQAAYRQLRRALPSPFSAFIGLDQGAVLSLSPERFIHTSGRQVETRPIKGTRPRGLTPKQDQAYIQALQTSVKDRAENLMIVDLLRNDLSKSCQPGSVRVPQLFAVESFPNVHHLVSTITGTLQRGKTPIDLLKGCFPGGSITGAPKRRAMEIIEELEPSRRSIYCGSIGYISANGNMDTNIAIRSLACEDNRIYCWGGGGIVADSDPDQEYAESLVKIQVILDSLSKPVC